MEGLLAVVIGATALALSPLVPVLRPVAKTAVKGGLAVSAGARAAAAAASQQLDKARSRSRPAEEAVEAEDAQAESPTEEAATATEAVEAAASEAPTEDTPAMGDKPAPGLIDVDGIGPKTVELLTAAGVTSLEQLAAMDEAQLHDILAQAGPRYRILNPSTWPDQARRLLESGS